MPTQDRQTIEKILVADLTDDSRSLSVKGSEKGQNIFVAVQGQYTHGREYIKFAINQGVAMVLVETDNVKTKSSTARLEWVQRTPVIHIPQLRQQLGNFASQFYHYPSQRL
ncbi:MAG: Mur ligase domain-containing protein, partial [Pseudomonadota bacterium]